jgi:hypothetical protein
MKRSECHTAVSKCPKSGSNEYCHGGAPFTWWSCLNRRQTIRWQLYAGWRTGVNGTRQTRRSPTHSRHDKTPGIKKAPVVCWGAVAPFTDRVAKPGRWIYNDMKRLTFAAVPRKLRLEIAGLFQPQQLP